MEKVFIPGTDNKYEITTEGQIISYLRYPNGKVLKPHVSENGYLTTTIKQDGKFKSYYIHRLVAQIFIPNPDNLPYVNHKSEDRTDNRMENLEWCTAEYNCNYGNHRENLIKATLRFTGHPSRIAKLDKQGNLLKAYYSIKAAARDVAGDNWNSAAVQISKIIKGVKGHHTCCGFKWKRISEDEYIDLLRKNNDWIPEETNAVRLLNYKIGTYIDKTIRKYNPRTGEFTEVTYREKSSSPKSCPLF